MIALGGLLLVFAAGYVGYALGDYDGYRGGYQEGYKVGRIAGAGSGYTLRNPTYSELRDFLEQDRTNERAYQERVYTCVNFVGNLNTNAEYEDFRAPYVYIEYSGYVAHSVATFETVDQGLIFIEPQYYSEVEIRQGISYARETGMMSQTMMIP